MPDKFLLLVKSLRATGDNTINRIKTRVFAPANMAPSTSDQGKFWAAKAKAEPSAKIANTIRTILPVPKNVASLPLKKTIGNPMNSKSINSKEKAVMARVVNNAYKRTGKLSGGTEYEDYRGTTNPRIFEEIMNAKNGNINPVLGTVLGAVDPAYRMATTTGRGSYYINPENKEDIIYTDDYDFINNYTQGKDGKLKNNYMTQKTGDPSINRYRSIRRNLAIGDQTKSKPESNRIQFSLKSSDTSKLPLYNSFKTANPK